MSKPPPSVIGERILILDADDAETRGLPDLLGRAGLNALMCEDAERICTELDLGAGLAVLTEESLTPSSMKCLVEALGKQALWSDFPLLILFGGIGRTPETHLRMLDLLEPLGNATILQRPVAAMALVSAVRSALRARGRQYQVRDLLEGREKAVRQRDRFLNLLSHELRNPLGVIRSASYVLEKVGGGSLLAREQQASIGRQVSRLSRWLDKSLAMFQVVAGQVRLHRETIDLVSLATKCLRQFAADDTNADHQLALRNDADTLPVEADGQRLEQVIDCLIGYALETSPPGSRVVMELGARDGNAVIRVRDAGKDLSDAERANLLAPADDTELPAEEGPHLGLALAAALTELHGGQMSASSGGPRRGTDMTVQLPLRAMTARPAPAPGPVQTIPKRSKRILVIEDNNDGRESLRLMLQLWGHQVEVAADGSAGVQKALARPPEVGLFDIGLPGLDGYQVAQKLRAALGDTIYLIAMTGYGQPHDRQRALDAGFNVHLVKPLVPENLQEILGNLV